MSPVFALQYFENLQTTAQRHTMSKRSWENGVCVDLFDTGLKQTFSLEKQNLVLEAQETNCKNLHPWPQFMSTFFNTKSVQGSISWSLNTVCEWSTVRIPLSHYGGSKIFTSLFHYSNCFSMVKMDSKDIHLIAKSSLCFLSEHNIYH